MHSLYLLKTNTLIPVTQFTHTYLAKYENRRTVNEMGYSALTANSFYTGRHLD